MENIFNLKFIKNKANGQINTSIPKKLLSPELKKFLDSRKKGTLKVKLEGVDI